MTSSRRISSNRVGDKSTISPKDTENHGESHLGLLQSLAAHESRPSIPCGGDHVPVKPKAGLLFTWLIRLSRPRYAHRSTVLKRRPDCNFVQIQAIVLPFDEEAFAIDYEVH